MNFKNKKVNRFPVGSVNTNAKWIDLVDVVLFYSVSGATSNA